MLESPVNFYIALFAKCFEFLLRIIRFFKDKFGLLLEIGNNFVSKLLLRHGLLD